MRPRRPKQYCLQLDIALWCKNQIEHSIWDESLLLCNCACSLEYFSLSTLAGLSYHICGKLEVAFKASPSSQHQHCTDEAQDACLMLLRSVLVNVTDTFSFVFAVMPFARSVVLHFPAEIHQAQGVSEVAPQLLQALDVEKIAAVQFLKNGQVRVTCKTAEYRDDLLEGSTFLFGDVPIPVTAADLPFGVPDCDVKSAFESFGVVLSVHQCFLHDLSSVSVADLPVRVFHAGQPVFCSICHESGHLPRDCPFSGLCLHCKQPGHIARHCTQPWGPSSSSPPVSTSSPQFVPSSVPSSSSSVSAFTIPSTSVSAPVPSVQSHELTTPEVGEVFMSSDLSVADASPPRRPRPRVPSSADYKKLVRLVLPKVKLGSDSSTVKKLCLSLVKTHKLSVSDDECTCVPTSDV